MSSSLPVEPGAPTRRTRLRRHAERGVFDRQAIYAILDEALIAHVGVQTDAGPVVLPMAYGRVGDHLYLHGALANSMLAAALAGPVCVTVTLLDGLVLARSWFHHSMNFRSVVAYGRPETVEDPEEKLAGMRALVDHVARDRSRDARRPTDSELRSTLVLRLELTEASAKVRSGGPLDDAGDIGLGVWAGEIPLSLAAAAPVPDPSGPPVRPPDYVSAHTGKGAPAAW